MVRRDDKKTTNAVGRLKLRYFELEMDGGTEALEEGIRSLATAITGRPAATFTRAIGAPKAKSGAEGTNPSETNSGQHDLFAEGQPETTFSEETEVPVSPERPRKARSIPPTPKVLNDLELTSGEVSFRAFVEKKNPQKQIEKFAVVGAWFKKYRQQEEITPDHIYTCFQFLGGSGAWRSPDDIGQGFRNIKARKGWFDRGSSDNAWKITIVGLNAVDEMGTK